MQRITISGLWTAGRKHLATGVATSALLLPLPVLAVHFLGLGIFASPSRSDSAPVTLASADDMVAHGFQIVEPPVSWGAENTDSSPAEPLATPDSDVVTLVQHWTYAATSVSRFR
jgi:hypothetical protein